MRVPVSALDSKNLIATLLSSDISTRAVRGQQQAAGGQGCEGRGHEGRGHEGSPDGLGKWKKVDKDSTVMQLIDRQRDSL